MLKLALNPGGTDHRHAVAETPAPPIATVRPAWKLEAGEVNRDVCSLVFRCRSESTPNGRRVTGSNGDGGRFRLREG